jgi:hypothetical protein
VRAPSYCGPIPSTGNDSSEERGVVASVGGDPRDEDRRLALAFATDLATLGQDHAT